MESRVDAGDVCVPLAAPLSHNDDILWKKKVSLQRLPENFMRIRGIIKCNRKLMCGQNPFEGCARLQVRLDICFMAAEHDWAG